MDIFESLENLNVSEECFNEIMGLVEEELNKISHITRVHGVPRGSRETGNKAAKLAYAANDAQSDEFHDAVKRDAGVSGKDIDKLSDEELEKCNNSYQKIKKNRKYNPMS